MATTRKDESTLYIDGNAFVVNKSELDRTRINRSKTMIKLHIDNIREYNSVDELELVRLNTLLLLEEVTALLEMKNSLLI